MIGTWGEAYIVASFGLFGHFTGHSLLLFGAEGLSIVHVPDTSAGELAGVGAFEGRLLHHSFSFTRLFAGTVCSRKAFNTF